MWITCHVCMCHAATHSVTWQVDSNPCEISGNWSYQALHCSPSRAVSGPPLVCHDEGYKEYESAHAACEATRHYEAGMPRSDARHFVTYFLTSLPTY